MGGVPVVSGKLDSVILVSEFKLQSHYYVHLLTITCGKGMKYLILRALG